MAKTKDYSRRGPFRDGVQDGLEPTQPVDLSRVTTVNDLVTQMGKTAFGARRLGEAADVLETMARDADCFTVLTLSGAMTVAKMGLVVCDLIDHGLVQPVVSTGAVMAHGLVEAVGMRHFKYRQDLDDMKLYLAGYNRIYDTLELEKNLDQVQAIVARVLESLPRDEPLCSRVLNAHLGRYLAENSGEEQRGILKSAGTKQVPVYIPAFTDSELALDIGVFNRSARARGESAFTFDAFLDLDHYADLMRDQETLGILTVGGGVPRNWGQQVGPYLDILKTRVGDGPHGGAFQRFTYGVRICPEPVHWGGLSGCTYLEGVSWGKFAPPEEGGRWAEVHADATIALPLLVKAVLERLGRQR
jgi:deoxyhypusine synthase